MIYNNFTPETLKNKRTIHTFRNGDYLAYFHFKFDNFCVALIKGDKVDIPQDKEYFVTLKRLGKTLGYERTYSFFLRVWALVYKGMENPDPAHWKIIEKWTWEFLQDRMDLFDIAYETICILYLAMIAEENHTYNGKYPPVGKDVKKIGVYQILLDGFTSESAAEFSKKKKWKELAALSKEHNISFGLPKSRWRVNGFA